MIKIETNIKPKTKEELQEIKSKNYKHPMRIEMEKAMDIMNKGDSFLIYKKDYFRFTAIKNKEYKDSHIKFITQKEGSQIRIFKI